MTFALNQPITLTFLTYSDSARTTLADATTVAVDILDPTGITTTYTLAGGQVVRSSTGTYTLGYSPASAGHYRFHWRSTGTAATALDGSFDVDPEYGGAVLLGEVKQHLNIEPDDDSNDTELGFVLAVASDWVAAKVTDVTAAPVRMAILELVRHMWETQRGNSSGRPIPGGSEDLAASGPDDFLTIPRVRELLGPYLARPEPVGSFPCPQVWPDDPRTFPPLTWAERLAWDPNR